MSNINDREYNRLQSHAIGGGQSTKDQPYLYWLFAIDGIGKKTIDILMKSFGSAEEIFNAPDERVKRYLTEKQMLLFKRARTASNPIQMYNELQKNNIRFIPFSSHEFPEKLCEIPDAPYALYVKGQLPDPQVPSVAIIGARLCSEYGRYMARVFGQELGAMGIQIISGMAMGIDGIAEKAAFQAGGTSFSVLGCGVDICYPTENTDLYEMCVQRGGLISEYPPGTVPRPSLFPPRNRIISGLADAVLVIEARAKSGTLITVDMALEQGREVYVLPGRVTDRLSDGCNSLLKQGALIATCAADIAEDLYRKGQDFQRVSFVNHGEENNKHAAELAAGQERIQSEIEKTSNEKVGKQSADKQAGPRTAGHQDGISAGRTATRTEFPCIPEQFDASDPDMISAAILYVLDVTPKTVGDIETALARKDIHIHPSQLMCTMVDLELCGRVYREGGSYSLRY